MPAVGLVRMIRPFGRRKRASCEHGDKKISASRPLLAERMPPRRRLEFDGLY